MDKESILNLLLELDFPKEEFYVIGGSSLVLRGIREKAGDIDLCISSELFSKIKDKYMLTDEKKNACGFYKIYDNLEIVINDKKDFNMEDAQPYNLENINTILNFKINRNTPKDQIDIIKIKEYMKRKSL